MSNLELFFEPPQKNNKPFMVPPISEITPYADTSLPIFGLQEIRENDPHLSRLIGAIIGDSDISDWLDCRPLNGRPTLRRIEYKQQHPGNVDAFIIGAGLTYGELATLVSQSQCRLPRLSDFDRSNVRQSQLFVDIQRYIASNIISDGIEDLWARAKDSYPTTFESLNFLDWHFGYNYKHAKTGGIFVYTLLKNSEHRKRIPDDQWFSDTINTN
ncbi:MAG: hypothetical protein ACYDAS_01235 [Patescibacteria group bacterium]